MQITADDDGESDVDINIFTPKDMGYPGIGWTTNTLNGLLTKLLNTDGRSFAQNEILRFTVMIYSHIELNLGNIIIRKILHYDRVLWSHKMEYAATKKAFLSINNKWLHKDTYPYSKRDEIEFELYYDGDDEV